MAFFPQHYLGAIGMPNASTYPADAGWNLWNMVSTIGAFALGVGLSSWSTLRSLRGGRARQPIRTDAP